MTTEADLRRELAELRSENNGLRAIIEERHPGRMPWDLRKVARQRAALDRLNRRIISLRFVVRTLNELGRGLTREEYLTTRKAVGNEQLRDRIFEKIEDLETK